MFGSRREGKATHKCLKRNYSAIDPTSRRISRTSFIIYIKPWWRDIFLKRKAYCVGDTSSEEIGPNTIMWICSQIKLVTCNWGWTHFHVASHGFLNSSGNHFQQPRQSRPVTTSLNFATQWSSTEPILRKQVSDLRRRSSLSDIFSPWRAVSFISLSIILVLTVIRHLHAGRTFFKRIQHS